MAIQVAGIQAEFPELVDIDEQAQIAAAQAGFINFYDEDAVNPYVAVAARGPWVVTLKGGVIHDSRGVRSAVSVSRLVFSGSRTPNPSEAAALIRR
jgi:hypothetical protein